jgi:hypothetical protein
MGMSPDMAAKYRPVQEGMEKIVKALYDEGVPLVAGRSPDKDQGYPECAYGHQGWRNI